MPSVFAQCPDCLAVRQVPIEHLGRNAECPCGAAIVLTQWTCGECNQILRNEAADKCPRCHALITPRLTTHSPATLFSNTEGLADRPHNHDIPATNSESAQEWAEEAQPGISNRSRYASEGNGPKSSSTRTLRSRDDDLIVSTASKADSWRQREEADYAKEQELIAQKQQDKLAASFKAAFESERKHLQDKIDTLEEVIAKYERSLAIQGGSAFEILKVVIFRKRTQIKAHPVSRGCIYPTSVL